MLPEFLLQVPGRLGTISIFYTHLFQVVKVRLFRNTRRKGMYLTRPALVIFAAGVVDEDTYNKNACPCWRNWHWRLQSWYNCTFVSQHVESSRRKKWSGFGHMNERVSDRCFYSFARTNQATQDLEPWWTGDTVTVSNVLGNTVHKTKKFATITMTMEEAKKGQNLGVKIKNLKKIIWTKKLGSKNPGKQCGVNNWSKQLAKEKGITHGKYEHWIYWKYIHRYVHVSYFPSLTLLIARWWQKQLFCFFLSSPLIPQAQIRHNTYMHTACPSLWYNNSFFLSRLRTSAHKTSTTSRKQNRGYQRKRIYTLDKERHCIGQNNILRTAWNPSSSAIDAIM